MGRLSFEKNIAGLVQVQNELEQTGRNGFRFLIIGHGGDEAWLREHLRHAEFAGVLRGEALATAYANMDLFVFPSHTDTFGNVVLEALASGVPAIVTPVSAETLSPMGAPTGALPARVGTSFARPKSRILAWPRRVTKRFAGLISR